MRTLFTERRWSRRELFLLVALVAVAVYANSLLNGFALDDLWVVARNPRIAHWTHLSDLWLTPYWYANGTALGLYRPLTIFAFAMEWAIGSGAPVVFHTVNVVLQALVSGLVFLLLDVLWSNRRAALLGALVFAVHPLHTEAVANVVGQSELLAAAGVLVACIAYASRPGLAVSGKRLAVIIVAFLLGVLGKESAFVLPGLLVLLDIAQRRAAGGWRGFLRYLDAVAFPLIMVLFAAAAYLLLRFQVLGSITGGRLTPGYSFLLDPTVRVLTAFRAWPEYARLLFFPAHLSADYSPGVILPVRHPTPMMGLGVLLLFGTVALALAIFRRPLVGLPAAWFLVTILPVSNLLFPVGVIVAERTLYLPSLAVSLAVGAAFVTLEQRAREGLPEQQPQLRAANRWAVVALGIALVLMSVRSVIRNPVWRNNAALTRTTLRTDPESYRMQWVAASDALEAGDTASGLKHWILSRRLYPNDSEESVEFAEVLVRMGRPLPAIALLEQALHSDFFPIRAQDLLAVAYLRIGAYRKALVQARRLATVTGDTPRVEELRGWALWGLGALPQARDAAGRALHMHDGDDWGDWVLMARVDASLADTTGARAAVDSAIVLARPDSHQFAKLVGSLRNKGFLPPHASCQRFAVCEAIIPPAGAKSQVLKTAQ